jgi:hypothetical protein
MNTIRIGRMMTSKAKQSMYSPIIGPEVSRKLKLPDFKKVVKLSALRTGRLCPQEMLLVLILLKAESTPGP